MNITTQLMYFIWDFIEGMGFLMLYVLVGTIPAILLWLIIEKPINIKKLYKYYIGKWKQH